MLLDDDISVLTQNSGERDVVYSSKKKCVYDMDDGRHEITHTFVDQNTDCLLYTSPSPRDKRQSRMPSSA